MKNYLSILIFAIIATSTLAQGSLEREETGVQQAFETFGVTGDGTIVAILDRGIDWNHPGFKNEDGTTRIKYIFDMLDDTGASDQNNSYGVGTIYTEDDINNAISNGTTLNTRDAVGHGVTTTGIACGNGAGSPDNIYKGMAPEASIIVVKITSDGAPAHDDQPAEDAFYDPSYVPIAIDFVTDKAAELDMPAVMLLNLGSQGGPTDGTSSMARKISETVGAGIPGLVFVTGSSDDGSMPNKAAGSVELDGTTEILIEKGDAGSLFFDLWYYESDRFDVSIETPNGNFGPYISPSQANSSDLQQNSDFLYYHLGKDADFYQATNDKREIWIRIDGPTGQYKILLNGKEITEGTFQATLNPSRIFGTGQNNKFLSHVTDGSIWDGASAINNIVPNSYVLRNEWVDIDGVSRTFTGEGNPGEIWTGSGIGPTFDGRIGIDVSAPGDRIITAYGEDSYWATSRFNLVENGNGLYGVAGAVSAANPIVTGIISLMLEVDPTLDAETIKAILQETAKSDEFTGETPNTTWGYGKVDALGAIEAVYDRLASVPIISGDLVAEAISSSEIKLSWDMVGLADNILIERSENENEGFIEIESVPSTAVEFKDTELEENTTYFYRIYAVNVNGSSVFSNVASSTTLEPLSIESNDSHNVAKVFPNPSNDVIKIVIPNNISGRFEIIDVSGKVIKMGGINGQTSIDLKDLKSGNYITRIFYEDVVEVFRIVNQ